MKTYNTKDIRNVGIVGHGHSGKTSVVAGLLFAAGAGAGLALMAELADKAIRRSSDIFAAVDRNLVVAIPYILTEAEVRSRKRMVVYLAIGAVLIVVGAIVAAYLFLPLDLMFAKLRVGLVR